MITIESPEAMIAWAEAARGAGRTIGLVPTMGYLHRGHLSLMERLRPRVDELVVSIYVNPLQFGEGEDLDRYPRDPEGDAARCSEVGVDCVFSPTSTATPGIPRATLRDVARWASTACFRPPRCTPRGSRPR